MSPLQILKNALRALSGRQQHVEQKVETFVRRYEKQANEADEYLLKKQAAELKHRRRKTQR